MSPAPEDWASALFAMVEREREEMVAHIKRRIEAFQAEYGESMNPFQARAICSGMMTGFLGCAQILELGEGELRHSFDISLEASQMILQGQEEERATEAAG